MIFAVPDMEYLTKTKMSMFCGIYFEHTIFLNKQNIEFMLNNNGFIISDYTKYNNHSDIYMCCKSNNLNKNKKCIVDNYINLFLENIPNNIDEINEIIKNNEVYIFGASYNTQHFISCGIKGLKGILDNSVCKQSKFFYGLKIYSPNILIGKENIYVILKNGFYVDEVKKQLLEINNNINFIL